MSHAHENQNANAFQLQESEGGEMQNSMQPPAFQLKASGAEDGGNGSGAMQLKAAEGEGKGSGAMQLKAAGIIQREPTSAQAGTIQEFVEIFNTTPSAMGTLTGQAAHDAMLRLGETEMSWSGPLPSTTPYFNTRPARYVYTTSGGWLDMVHFLFHAGRAYRYKVDKLEAIETIAELEALPWYQRMWIPAETWQMLHQRASISPVGESVQEGFQTERLQQAITPRSAFSYEDIPSDTFGARFAGQHFNSNSDLTFGQQLEAYVMGLGATNPEAAPNFADLPTADTDEPSRQNFTTTPVFTDANP